LKVVFAIDPKTKIWTDLHLMDPETKEVLCGQKCPHPKGWREAKLTGAANCEDCQKVYLEARKKK